MACARLRCAWTPWSRAWARSCWTCQCACLSTWLHPHRRPEMPRTDTMPHGIWLDHLAFAKATLLPDADLPWLDTPAFAQWLTKSHGLLGRQMVLVPVSAGIVAWLRAHPDAMQSMRQAKGPLG